MPYAPPTFRPNAVGTVTDKEKAWASRRDGRHALYNLWQWRGPKGIRRMRLDADPLCVECLKEKRYTAATEVDHIEPHGGDMDKFLDYDNTASLCKSCHSRKTMREQSGGNP